MDWVVFVMSLDSAEKSWFSCCWNCHWNEY